MDLFDHYHSGRLEEEDTRNKRAFLRESLKVAKSLQNIDVLKAFFALRARLKIN